MKLIHNTILTSNEQPMKDRFLNNSNVNSSKLKIQLKTHSLTSLNIPLKTCVGLDEIFPSYRREHPGTMIGSVDSISTIQRRINDEKDPRFASSSNEKSSFRALNTVNDSLTRLRRQGFIQNHHSSALQMNQKSIPKFAFRDLPSASRLSLSIHQIEQSTKSHRSLFASLPEIRSIVERTLSPKKKTNPTKGSFRSSLAPSSWKKSSSWSWKSNAALQRDTEQYEHSVSNLTTHEYQNNGSPFHSQLPVIVESPPMHPRHVTNPTNALNHLSSSKLHVSRPNQPKQSSFTHSISNYEISSGQNSFRSTTRYPSTPLLASSRPTNVPKHDHYSSPFCMPPMASFDEDESSDDTLSSSSSFRSCLNSMEEVSDIETTEMTSTLSLNCFDESSSDDLFIDPQSTEIKKRNRSSFRDICLIQ